MSANKNDDDHDDDDDDDTNCTRADAIPKSDFNTDMIHIKNWPWFWLNTECNL